MSNKPDMRVLTNANGERKRREQEIHNVIDRHKAGWNDRECMLKIRHILRRGIAGRGHEIEMATRGDA